MNDPRQFNFINRAQRMVGVLHQINRQPNWIMKAATLTFLIVIGVPILILLLLGSRRHGRLRRADRVQFPPQAGSAKGRLRIPGDKCG